MDETLNRELLYRITKAIEAGDSLTDDERRYAAQILTTANHLAFDGYDIVRIYRKRQRESKNLEVIRELQTFQMAHETGRGMKEAWALVKAERVNKEKGYHSLYEAINFMRVIFEMNEDQAIRAYAERHDRDIDTVDRQYKRTKARKLKHRG